MKIKVDREVSEEGDLVFTIRVTDGQMIDFSQHEQVIMQLLDSNKVQIEKWAVPNNELMNLVLGLIHHTKEKFFCKTLEHLKFAIRNQLQIKFNPICQEIYNWIYDQQGEPLKKWMQEFDPQRTTYYFDNDAKSVCALSQRGLVADKEEGDEDEEDEE